jgi:hypothetical protein
MLKGTSLFTGQRWALVGLVAILGLTVVGTGTASANSSGRAVIAKKCKRRRRSAASAKKCKKKGTTPTTPTTTSPGQTGLPLTNDEVVNRIRADALAYCNADSECVGYDYKHSTPGVPECSSMSTYSWTCVGYTLESGFFTPPFAECDFADVVERDGYNGIKSHLDTSYGGTGGSPPGWLCHT